jgi:hypothetical protein
LNGFLAISVLLFEIRHFFAQGNDSFAASNAWPPPLAQLIFPTVWQLAVSDRHLLPAA